jgi:hypothetical protein
MRRRDLGMWRFMPLPVVQVVGGLTRDQARYRKCMEVARLARRDAALIPSYTAGPSST